MKVSLKSGRANLFLLSLHKAYRYYRVTFFFSFSFFLLFALLLFNIMLCPQDFCHGQVMWPPLSALQVKLAEPGHSCKQVCQEEQLICEPSFFQHLNKDKDLARWDTYFASILVATRWQHDTSLSSCEHLSFSDELLKPAVIVMTTSGLSLVTEEKWIIKPAAQRHQCVHVFSLLVSPSH